MILTKFQAIQAISEGKKVQFNALEDQGINWIDIDESKSVIWIANCKLQFRIKPECIKLRTAAMRDSKGRLYFIVVQAGEETKKVRDHEDFCEWINEQWYNDKHPDEFIRKGITDTKGE